MGQTFRETAEDLKTLNPQLLGRWLEFWAKRKGETTHQPGMPANQPQNPNGMLGAQTLETRLLFLRGSRLSGHYKVSLEPKAEIEIY